MHESNSFDYKDLKNIICFTKTTIEHIYVDHNLFMKICKYIYINLNLYVSEYSSVLNSTQLSWVRTFLV